MRLIALIAVIGIFAVELRSVSVEAQGQPAGYVKVAVGAGDIVRSGTDVRAHPGDAVYENDALRTGADGHLGVTLKDDTRVSLGPNSEINLSEFKFSPEEGQLGLAMKLLRGVAAIVTGRITDLRPEAVHIETPTAIIGVRGTHLAIRVQEP